MKNNLLFTAIIIFLFSACSTESSRKRADDLSRDHRYEEAIEEYKAHIQTRLAVKDRPEWENPYIYMLDIGDIYLAQGELEKAIESYKIAEEKGVKKAYIADRFRYIATWYEEKGDLKAALKHLEKYRDKDPLLFDLMLDRLARTMIEQEDSQADPTK